MFKSGIGVSVVILQTEPINRNDIYFSNNMKY